MALPNYEWFEIVAGPGLWKMARVLFRDEQEEVLESCKCTFSILGSPSQSNHSIKVSIEKVKRTGSEGGQGYYFYDIEGYVLEIDDEKWPLCGATWFHASFDPECRRGSLKLTETPTA